MSTSYAHNWEEGRNEEELLCAKTNLRKGEIVNWNDGAQIATQVLCNVGSTKEWAHELRVSVRMIQSWISGERRLGPEWIRKILIIGTGYFEHLEKLEREVIRELARAYGPFDRGDY